MHKHSNKHKLSVNERAEQQRLQAQQQQEEIKMKD
ncbi:cell surface antigen-like protein Sca10 [Rickettsia massiliae str. AZT80]|uniref:Cell surface antigen-like protein Sca10 n=1 Tax=Rickettsia massiliae str. AZT80 TaxID=1105112 RepID=H6QKM2_RICMA|nr:cell surface antigen-like protein Sca10 [Rickettsia massiliae str. AZT80]